MKHVVYNVEFVGLTMMNDMGILEYIFLKSMNAHSNRRVRSLKSLLPSGKDLEHLSPRESKQPLLLYLGLSRFHKLCEY